MRSIPLTLILLYLLSILLPIDSISAQPVGFEIYPGSSLRFEHLSIDDGLSQNAGLALLQDRQGYLWIGTQDGLNRYDGYNLTQFKHDPADPQSISHNGIITLYEDDQGSLWIGTWGGGLNRLDPARQAFTRYLPDAANPASLSNPVVTAIVPASDGGLWIGSLGGLQHLDPQSGVFTAYPLSSQPSDPLPVSVILPAPDGSVWVGSGTFSTPGSGLYHLNPLDKTLKHRSAPAPCLQSPNISDLVWDKQGNLWISFGGYGVSGGGIDRYNPEDGTCAHFDNAKTFDNQIVDNNVTDLMFDARGNLWATSWSSGLWHMPANQPGAFTGIRHNPYDPDSLSNDNTFSLMQDRSGVVWIGTLSAGVNKLDLDTLQFRLYRKNPADARSLPSNHVGAFAQTSDGSLWVGTWESGLARFHPQRGQFTLYQNVPANENSLSSDLVMSLYGDRDNNLWIGTLGGGLNRLEPSRQTFTRYRNDPHNPASLLDDQVTHITQDAQGRLWVSTMKGLSRLDPGRDEFVNYSLPAPAVRLFISHDDLWIGSWGGGAWRLDLSNADNLDAQRAQFTNLVHDPADANSLSENSVWSIHQTGDGMMWFATQGGLNRFNPQTREFRVYTEKDGLRNATILGILEDPGGFLWLTTNNGLAKFDPRQETFRIYDKSNGLQSNEFNSNAYFASPLSGEFFVGGVDGFNVFDPMRLQDNMIPPPVVITAFNIFDNPYPFDHLNSSPLVLSYQQNSVSFQFAALDFHASQKNQYAYMLEGFDPHWIQAGQRNFASYTNLPAGEYVFRVKAANEDGIWNESGASLALNIIPPFWQTPPFILGIGLLIALLAAGGYQWRLSAVKADARRLETIVAERTEALNQTNRLLEQEVEQRKRAEAELAQRAANELQESQSRFQAVFENTAVGVALMTLDRKIVQINPTVTRITGYTSEEMARINPTDLVVPEDRFLDRGLFTELIAGKRDQYLIEKRYLRKDGSVFWGRVNFSLVRGWNRQPLYIIGIIEDITEEKQIAEMLAAKESEYRATLEQRITERTEELNRLNERLREKAASEAVLAERTRLARDLHDAVTQTLFSTTLIAEVLPQIWEMNREEGARRLEELRLLTRGALAEMRTLLVELRPNALVEVPLPILIRQLTEAMVSRSPVRIQFSAEGERKLPADVQVGLYRIAQEALNNVAKHANATQAIITLRLDEPVRLSMADNGSGFDPATVTADHLGLKIMRERAEAINARLSLYSEPGEGTQVTVTWYSPDSK
ncbi:MAG: two-component regulator propeller domain-containing protein [Chloroflexota bacterium]